MTIELVNYIDREPRESTQCKFVIITEDPGNQFVLLGSYEQFPFHAHLVAKFCLDRDILVQSQQGGEFYEIIDPRYSVSGGGWIEIDPHKKLIRCNGTSKAYGQFSHETMRRIQLSETIWSGYQLSIER